MREQVSSSRSRRVAVKISENKKAIVVGAIAAIAVSTVILLILTSQNYYQKLPANLGRTSLARFNVTNATDRFGILKIYPTAKDGETWFFNSADPNDGQFDPNGAEVSRNQDGSWHVNPGITRILSFTKSSGHPSDKLRSNLPTYNYSKLAEQGYWYKPSDWKNVEVTGYFKFLSADPTASEGNALSLVTRSVRHNENVHLGCGGSSYHNNIELFHGKFNFKKEEWHVHYDILPLSENGIGPTFGRWVGFKGIVYNLPDGKVKLESYVDKQDNNHWEKADEYVDSGNWGDDMTRCGAKTPGALISWASPMVIFKSTYVTYDFGYLSVREIQPFK